MIRKVGLCAARHEMPVQEFIFKEIPADRVTDPEWLEETASGYLSRLGVQEVEVYVTGLTVALIAALNAARELGIKVTLYHFDRDTGKYFRQEVK